MFECSLRPYYYKYFDNYNTWIDPKFVLLRLCSFADDDKLNTYPGTHPKQATTKQQVATKLWAQLFYWLKLFL